MNEVEKANAELVLSWFKRWEGDFDPAAAYPEHFAPDARHRAESGVQSPVQTDLSKWHIGADDFVADAQMYIDMGMTAKALIHEVYACGPMVVVDRTDYCWLPGATDRAVRMIGMFFVINGRIVEWSDFYGDRTPSGEGAG